MAVPTTGSISMLGLMNGGITSAWDSTPNLDNNNPINMSEFRGGALNDDSSDP